MPKATVVRWGFNRAFRVSKTFPTKAAALRYAERVRRLWGDVRYPPRLYPVVNHR